VKRTVIPVARWMKFNLVGAIGIVVQLGALALFTSVFRLDYMIATALAVETAVLHNFAWHERYTWADRSSQGWHGAVIRLLRFNLTTGAVSIGGNLVLIRLLTGKTHIPPLGPI
jgi:putative flippase GtrA